VLLAAKAAIHDYGLERKLADADRDYSATPLAGDHELFSVCGFLKHV
jgi:hypothetical protein